MTQNLILRQGDLIQKNWHSNPLKTEWGLVIPTNCDMGFNKHRGLVTFIDLMLASDYVNRFVLPEIVNSAISNLKKRILEEKNKKSAKDFTFSKISDDRFIEWLSDSGPNETLLHETAKKWSEVLSFRDLLKKSKDESLATIEGQLRYCSELSNFGLSLSTDKVINKIYSKVENLPGDFHWIAGGEELTHGSGYVANLRDIRVIEESRIHLNFKPRGFSRDGEWVRIAKLKDYFLHLLTQKFGLVFGSIGLPNEFERGFKSSLEILRDEMESKIA